MGKVVILLYLIKAEKFSQCPLNKSSKIFFFKFATHMRYEQLTYISKICLSENFLNQSKPSLGYGLVRISFANIIAARAAQLQEM